MFSLSTAAYSRALAALRASLSYVDEGCSEYSCLDVEGRSEKSGVEDWYTYFPFSIPSAVGAGRWVRCKLMLALL
jgi:hypothetical protein